MSTDNNLEMTSPSPVVTNSAKKKWQSQLALFGVGGLVLGSIAFHHFTKSNDKPVQEEPVSSQAIDISAPQLSPLQQQMQQIESAVPNQQNSFDSNSDENREAEKLEKMRMVAPTTIYSSSSGTASVANTSNNTQGSNAVLGGNGTGDANTQFMARISDSGVPTAFAVRMEHPQTTLAQGTIIWATLESRMQSDLPGMIRAVTSEDIYSEDGSQVLLPRGSILIGQYINAIAQGQERFFVVWQRVLRPDHISIQLNSPGTDPLGTAGFGADSINRHFFEQFGNSMLLSIIGAGVSNNGVSTQDQFNSASAYREALSNSFAQTAQNTLQNKGVINPTLYKNQGQPISVFVARDLDFYSALMSR